VWELFEGYHPKMTQRKRHWEHVVRSVFIAIPAFGLFAGGLWMGFGTGTEFAERGIVVYAPTAAMIVAAMTLSLLLKWWLLSDPRCSQCGAKGLPRRKVQVDGVARDIATCQRCGIEWDLGAVGNSHPDIHHHHH